MYTNINPHAQAFQRFRTELAEAVKWSNPSYTNSAITRERACRVMEARKNLLGAIPDEETATGLTPAEYIDSLRPTTADQVAVAQFGGGARRRRCSTRAAPSTRSSTPPPLHGSGRWPRTSTPCRRW